MSVNSGNHMLKSSANKEHIAKQEVRIALKRILAEYSPFGKQTLYSHGIQSNLLPRTMVGIGFTWNLFDASWIGKEDPAIKANPANVGFREDESTR